MQMTSSSGLVPAQKSKRRCELVPLHLASESTMIELEKMIGGKTVEEAYAVLESSDVSVTNQRDKGQQLPKLLALDEQVRQ